MSAILLQIWNYFSWRTKFALILLLFCLLAFFYLYYEKSVEKRKIEEQLNQFIESQAIKDSQRIEHSKNKVKQAEEATNTAKNANYSNLSDTELRRRLIEEARK